MRLNDAVTGGALVIFAIAEITYARTFPSLHGQSYGPDLFPSLIGAGLIGCGTILIARGIQEKRTALVPQSWVQFEALTNNRSVAVNFLLVLTALLLYILLSSWIGFIPMSLIILTTLLYRLGSTLLISAVVAILATVIIQLVFAKVLLVPLPLGLLTGLVW